MKLPFRARSQPEADDLAFARRLFAEAGPFGHFPGPAMLLGHDGEVLAANREAKASPVLGSPSALARLQTLVLEALDSETAATVRLSAGELPAEAEAAGLELTIVPHDGGRRALVLGRDTQLDHALRDALVESRGRYKDLVEISSDFSWETDASGTFVFVSPGGALGYAADDLVGHRPEEFLAEPSVADARSVFSPTSPVGKADIWWRHRRGSEACLVVSAIPLYGVDGRPRGARGICHDVTEARHWEERLAHAQSRERLMAYVTRAIRDEIDPAEMLRAAARAVGQGLGATACAIYRQSPETGCRQAMLHGTMPNDRTALTAALEQAISVGKPVATDISGQHVAIAPTSYRRQTNGALCLVANPDARHWSENERALIADIAGQIGIALEQIGNQERLERMSRVDELTGLLNRRAFSGDLQARLERPVAAEAAGALFFVDLDNFKLVNDRFGHERGDEALVATARLLVEGTRPGDLVARLGGDEFALWLDRVDEPAAVERAQQLLAAARTLAPYSGDADRALGFSIGIAVRTVPGNETLDEIMARADQAMYDVKHGGKQGMSVAQPAEEGQHGPPRRSATGSAA